MIRIIPLILLSTLSMSAAFAQEPPRRRVQYGKDVLPILAENCFACHGFDEAAREADLRLDVREAASHVLGSEGESEILSRIRSDDLDLVMPPRDSGKSLSAEQIRTLRDWISQGAEYERHWSFILPQKESPPVGPHDHPIDRFVVAQLPENQSLSRQAEPATLLRRLSLDLIGLPPTIEELEAFEAAWSKDQDQAWASAVERLLASPHYGERWGRWWLDQARYADSNGYSVDAPRSIWKYRDWVVNALNDDMSFDQFTIEQLAGDLLPNATQSQHVATGFHRNTQINQEGGIDREQFRVDSVVDRVGTTGTVWLGLTIGCAQCHDHKFDPILQKEFYKLFAFLNNQDEPTIKVYGDDVDVAAVTRDRKQAESRLKQILRANETALSDWEGSLDEAGAKSLSGNAQKSLKVERGKRKFSQQLDVFAASPFGSDEFASSRKVLDDCDRILNDAPTTMVLRERKDPRKTQLLIKGDFTRPDVEVTPGTPAVLHPLGGQESLNRLDLARWIASPDNPLTPRVIVNRIWQQYFGRGLVSTENDFGLLGARPSHPELLDWLALQFVDASWSLKAMHRLIVTSETYRQTSVTSEAAKRDDPNNDLLARQNRLRLDAEIIRDVALTASGLLSTKQGGPPVYPPIPDGVMSQGQVRRSWRVSEGEDRFRRGMYTFVYRATPPPSLNVFDAPDGFSSCTRRNRSNTPLQSLTLMNDSGFFEFAEALEKVIQSEGLATAFRRCTSRPPDADELAVLQRLDTLTAARAMLNLDETITRE